MKLRFLPALLLSVCAFTAHALEFTSGNIVYEADPTPGAHTCKVSGLLSTDISGTLEIPSTVSFEGVDYAVTALGDYAFSYASSLTGITLPDAVRTLPRFAFYGCTSLTHFSAGELVEIGDFAFYGCANLETIPFTETLQKIGEQAFTLCRSLGVDTVAGTDLVIGPYAFSHCYGLKKLTFVGVSEIGEEAFSNCTGLENISFDDTIFRIRERAFRGSDGITEVECLRKNPPFLALTAFSDAVYKAATLIVPDGCRLLYMQTPPWNEFMSFQEVAVKGVKAEETTALSATLSAGNLTISGPEGVIRIVSTDGRDVYSGRKGEGPVTLTLPSHGIYIITLGNQTLKIKN